MRYKILNQRNHSKTPQFATRVRTHPLYIWICICVFTHGVNIYLWFLWFLWFPIDIIKEKQPSSYGTFLDVYGFRLNLKKKQNFLIAFTVLRARRILSGRGFILALMNLASINYEK